MLIFAKIMKNKDRREFLHHFRSEESQAKPDQADEAGLGHQPAIMEDLAKIGINNARRYFILCMILGSEKGKRFLNSCLDKGEN